MGTLWGHWRIQSTFQLENGEKWHSVLVPWFKCNRVHLAICTTLPKRFPDKQDTPILLLGGLPSDRAQEEEKADIWMAMGSDPKINKDSNTWYLIFQENPLKNNYRSDVHVADKWVIASLNLLVLGKKLQWSRSGIKSFATGIFTSFSVNKASFTYVFLYLFLYSTLKHALFTYSFLPFFPLCCICISCLICAGYFEKKRHICCIFLLLKYVCMIKIFIFYPSDSKIIWMKKPIS